MNNEWNKDLSKVEKRRAVKSREALSCVQGRALKSCVILSGAKLCARQSTKEVCDLELALSCVWGRAKKSFMISMGPSSMYKMNSCSTLRSLWFFDKHFQLLVQQAVYLCVKSSVMKSPLAKSKIVSLVRHQE